MNTRSASSCVLVAAVDASEIAPLVVQSALDAAREMKAAQVHFVHVRPWQEDGARHCEQRSAWLEMQLSNGGLVPPGTEVLMHESSGDPARAIVELANTLGAACIIVGARARNGGRNTLLGSVARAVVSNAACPVLVTRPQGPTQRTSNSMAPASAP